MIIAMECVAQASLMVATLSADDPRTSPWALLVAAGYLSSAAMTG
jgi:hypothetical protein